MCLVRGSEDEDGRVRRPFWERMGSWGTWEAIFRSAGKSTVEVWCAFVEDQLKEENGRVEGMVVKEARY